MAGNFRSKNTAEGPDLPDTDLLRYFLENMLDK